MPGLLRFEELNRLESQESVSVTERASRRRDSVHARILASPQVAFDKPGETRR